MYKNFGNELMGTFSDLSEKKLRTLYGLDFCLINWANMIISQNRCINSKKSFKNKDFTKLIVINSIEQKTSVVSFIAVLLCGGRAIRFGEIPKAIYRIEDLVNLCAPSFLEINILQIIKIEKLFNITVPIIIYTDYLSYNKILEHLKKNNYFFKNSKDFYFVKQSMGLRYIPSKQLLINNGFRSLLLNDKKGIKFLETTELFTSINIKDSIVGEGHFIFNSLINSNSFHLIIKKYPEINLLVISNIDNLGQKYFSNIIGSGVKKNFAVVCKKIKGEKMDNVFIRNNRLIIKPYFICKKNDGKLGFTATTYLQINDLLNIFGFKTKKEYLLNKDYRKINNNYYLIVKTPTIKGVKKTLVHFENSLSEISKFLSLEAVEVEREIAFHPFKESKDLNIFNIKSLLNAIEKYNYI